MSTNKPMYEQVKRMKGEKFARAVRDYHTGIFELENLLDKVRFASREPKEDVLHWLYLEWKDSGAKEKSEPIVQDPFELLAQAGYTTAFHVKTIEEQNSIKSYYRKGEELCTFHDNTRFKRYTMVHAIHKEASTVKPGTTPERQDAYGTSVISIQFRDGFISIKNRYNHTVSNPDNTFSSNPDNIIPGLTKALESRFKVDLSKAARNNTPEHHIVSSGKLVHYDFERNGVYVGEAWYVKNGKIIEVDKNSQVLADAFLFDFTDKTVKEVTGVVDGLLEVLDRPAYKNAVWAKTKSAIQIGSMTIGLLR